MDRDRNLLFGILAVQLRKLNPSQLVDVAAAWAADPTRGLPERVVESNMMEAGDRELIEALVEQAVGVHGGDTESTLATFGGSEEVSRAFSDSIEVTIKGEVVSSTPTRSLHLEVKKELSTVEAVEETPGRYTNPREYSRGGLGRILLVHDQFLGRHVALKELLPESDSMRSGLEDSPVRQAMPLVARFLQEARITGQLEHPSIIPVYELGRRKDGSVYYTMKLVRGKTLAQAIRGTESVSDRLELLPHFVDLCQAIAYAHSRGVIHRDIKPGNVMVGEFGETVVIDWGLAKAADTEDIHAVELEKTLHVMRLGNEADFAQTQYGELLGTPVYMSPEQAMGRIHEIDERSDVYSLGAVLFEILTGRPPFSGYSLPKILSDVADGEFDEALETDQAVPQELAAICKKAMNTSPKNRYQAAHEIASEIQSFLSGGLVKAHEYRISEHVVRLLKRHKPVAATVGAATLILVMIGLASAIRVERERQEADYNFYRASLGLAEQRLKDFRVEAALDLLFSCPSDYRGWEWGHLLQQANQDLMAFDVHAQPEWLEFSPDGMRIFVGFADRSVSELDLLSGKSTQKVFAEGWPTGMTFLTNNRVIAMGFHVEEDWATALKWDFATGEKLLSKRLWPNQHEDWPQVRVVFSETGKYVALLGRTSAIRIWDLHTGEAVQTLIAPLRQTILSIADFDESRSRFAVASGGRLSVWNFVTGELEWQSPQLDGGHEYLDVLLSRSGDWVQGVTQSGIIHNWRFDESKPQSADGPAEEWLRGRWARDTAGNTYVFSDGLNRTLLWTADGDGWRSTIQVPGFLPALSRDGAMIATVTSRERYGSATAQPSFSVRVWWTAEKNSRVDVLDDDDELIASTLSKDARFVASGSIESGILKVWDARSGDLISEFGIPSGERRSAALAFNQKGSLLVSSSLQANRGRVRVWSIPSGELIHDLDEERWVRDAVFDPSGSRLATIVHEENGVRIWDTSSWEPVSVASSVRVFTKGLFTPDGKHLVLCDDRGLPSFFDVQRESLRSPSVGSEYAHAPARPRTI